MTADCGELFTDSNGTTNVLCNRPKGHETSKFFSGKHWQYAPLADGGERVYFAEAAIDGPRVIVLKLGEPRY